MLAYFCQVAFMGVWPNALCICGAVLVMGSVVGIALEEKYVSDGSDGDATEGENAAAAAEEDGRLIAVMRRNSLTYP